MSDAGRGFGYWLNIFANLAVVAGIVFLGVEIRQNTAMTEAQINQSRTETSIDIQEAIFNSEFMPQVLSKVRRAEPLNEEEMGRFRRYFRASMRNFDNQLWQQERGFLGDNTRQSVAEAVRLVVGQTDLTITLWDETKASYSDAYVTFVDEAIADLRRETL